MVTAWLTCDRLIVASDKFREISWWVNNRYLWYQTLVHYSLLLQEPDNNHTHELLLWKIKICLVVQLGFVKDWGYLLAEVKGHDPVILGMEDEDGTGHMMDAGQ